MAMQEWEKWESEGAEQKKIGWKTAFPGKFMEVAEDLTSPLKIDGWKIKFPLEIVPFQWTFVNFRGICRIQSTHSTLWYPLSTL